MDDNTILSDGTQTTNVVEPVDKVRFPERLAFGLGDVAANFFLQMIAVFMVIFYTDVLGITAAAAGMVALISRLFDGVNDIAIGYLADRTGNYKKWVMIGTVFSAILFVTMFLSPPLGQTGKLVYAALSFSLFTVAYTAYQIPYTTLNSVISADPNERMKLNSVRFSIILIPILLVSVGVPLVMKPLSIALGGQQVAFPFLAGVFGLVGILTSFICVKGVKERVKVEKKSKESSISLKDSMAAIFQNKPLLALVVGWFAASLQYNMNSTASAYFFTYYLGDAKYISLFALGSIPFALLGMQLAPMLAKKVGKRNILIISGITIFSFSALRFALKTQILPLMIFTALGSIFTGVLNVICFTMVSDTVEYGYEKTGKDVRALNFSFFVFVQKVAMGVSAALVGFVLKYSGYVANAAQSDGAKLGLAMNYTLIPGAIMLLLSVSMLFWKIPDKKEKKA